MVRFFNALGAPLLAFCQYLGELVLLATDTARSIFTGKVRWKLFLNQVVEIGLLSQLVVIITGGFTGAVFSAQTFFQFNKLGMGSAVGAVVSVAICRDHRLRTATEKTLGRQAAQDKSGDRSPHSK